MASLAVRTYRVPEQALLTHFEVASLDGFGLRGMTLAVQAAGTIVQYLMETQAASLKLLTKLSTYSTTEFMNLGCLHSAQPGIDRDHSRWERSGQLVG